MKRRLSVWTQRISFHNNGKCRLPLLLSHGLWALSSEKSNIPAHVLIGRNVDVAFFHWYCSTFLVSGKSFHHRVLRICDILVLVSLSTRFPPWKNITEFLGNVIRPTTLYETWSNAQMGNVWILWNSIAVLNSVFTWWTEEENKNVDPAEVTYNFPFLFPVRVCGCQIPW